MKPILCAIFAVMLIGCSVLAQNPYSEKDAISKDHINLARQFIYFEIHGIIELDGHTFLGDTCSNPFWFLANADGIEIKRKTGDEKYKHRVCGVKDCGILHLELIVATFYTPSQPRYWFNYPNLLNGTIPAVIQDGTNPTHLK